MHCRCFHGSFLGVRRGKTGIQRHTVGTHERLGKIVALQAGDCGCTYNGLGLGPQQSSGQIHPAALSGQCPGMGHAVGHIAGFEGIPRQCTHQLQRGGACIDEHKIIGVDELRRSLCDAALLLHRQRFLCFHGGFVCQKTAVRQGGTAVHLVQLAQPVQFGQVAPDGGFAGVQRLAQFLHCHGALAVQLFHNQAEAFFCQHRHPLLWFDLIFDGL